MLTMTKSDTTASTLTYLFYHLAKEPSQIERLRAELKSLLKPDGEYDFKDLQGADYLNGVINETLRLHPPVPSGTLRLTPAEGLTIGSKFIPGGVTVVAPPYTIGRLESCFEKALEFVPERWSSKPEMVKNKSAYAPFSLGQYPTLLHDGIADTMSSIRPVLLCRKAAGIDGIEKRCGPFGNTI